MKYYDIILVVRVFHPNVGGMEHYTFELANRLGKKGKNVLVITSDQLNDGSRAIRQTYENFEVLTITSRRLGGYIIPFPVKLNHIRAETVHVFGLDPFVDFIRLKLNFTKLYLSPLGGFFHTPRHQIAKRIYGKIFTKFLYRNAKCFAISPADDQIINHFLGFESTYAGSGIHVRATASGSNVLVMGRISNNKRLDKCLEYGLQNFPDKTIYVIGTGETDFPLPTSTNIKMLGHVEDDKLNDIIKDCGYFISLSEFESLGLAAIEALRAGLVCILSPITSYKFIYDSILRLGVSPNIFFVDQGPITFNDLPLRTCNDKHQTAIDQIWSWDAVVKRIYSDEF